MEELFNKPITTKNLYAIYKYIYDNENTQEMFQLCCDKGFTGVLLSKTAYIKSSVKQLYDLDMLFKTNMDKYHFLPFEQINGNNTFVSLGLHQKIYEYCQWNDLKLSELSDKELDELKGDNDFWCRSEAHHYTISEEIYKKINISYI